MGLLPAEGPRCAKPCRDLLEAPEHIGLLLLVAVDLELLDDSQLSSLAGGLRDPELNPPKYPGTGARFAGREQLGLVPTPGSADNGGAAIFQGVIVAIGPAR